MKPMMASSVEGSAQAPVSFAGIERPLITLRATSQIQGAMRIALPLVTVLAVSVLLGCTKDAAFPDPGAGTVLELGFDWLTPVEVCIDSDDLAETWCGSLEWLDGERLMLELDGMGMAGWTGEGDEPFVKKARQSITLRYLYNPAMRTVTLYFTGAEVTLDWNENSRCLKGDLFDQDFLSICSPSHSVASGGGI